jgi:hypothetical protein
MFGFDADENCLVARAYLPPGSRTVVSMKKLHLQKQEQIQGERQ